MIKVQLSTFFIIFSTFSKDFHIFHHLFHSFVPSKGPSFGERETAEAPSAAFERPPPEGAARYRSFNLQSICRYDSNG